MIRVQETSPRSAALKGSPSATLDHKEFSNQNDGGDVEQMLREKDSNGLCSGMRMVVRPPLSFMVFEAGARSRVIGGRKKGRGGHKRG